MKILKCNLHTHFWEYYQAGAMRMVEAYRDAGYDCIALTEHCGFEDSFGETLSAAARSAERYGNEFLVIPGEELNFRISIDGRHYGMDLVGLFLTDHIPCGWTSEREPDTADFITGGEALDRIREQGGIGILAHDRLTAELWHPRSFGVGQGIMAWDFREQLAFDGWEVGNGIARREGDALGRELALSRPEESVAEGYIVTASSDAHRVEDVGPLRNYRTYLPVEERSVEGVRAALLERRAVAYCDGRLFGGDRMVEVVGEYIAAESGGR